MTTSTFDATRARRNLNDNTMRSDRQGGKPAEITPELGANEASDIDLGNVDALLDYSYRLVWEKREYEQAIDVLMEALGIQLSVRGKYHRETASTYSFIGTALWFSGDHHQALAYLCEAQRIFHRISIANENKIKNVNQINNRISKILKHLGLDPSAIAKYHDTLDSAMEHERVSDKYKKFGDKHMARLELQKARKCSEELKRLVRQRSVI